MRTYPSLAKAIIYGELADAQVLVAQGESVHDIDEYGFTPLIEAVIFSKIDIIEWLLSQGVDINQESTTGHSALYWAVENQQVELISLLLKRGADPNGYANSGQPILVLPVLRNQQVIKNLLYEYGANLAFAQDFIGTKLLAHRFEIMGYTNIISNEKRYIEVDLEGFLIEFTVGIIKESLLRFINHYSSRRLRRFYDHLYRIADAMAIADELLRYRHFSVNINEHRHRLQKLLNRPLLILPIGYTGHAIAYIRFDNLWVRCDRGEEGRRQGSVIIYEMQYPQKCNTEFLMNVIYKKQNEASIVEDIPAYLGLKPLTQLPIPTQVIGNCSWANIEAVIPSLLFLLLLGSNKQISADQLIDIKKEAQTVFLAWRYFDKQSALQDFVQQTEQASMPRKASKAMLLMALMFQKLSPTRFGDIQIADQLIPILMQPELRYILESYIDIYYRRKVTRHGQRLLALIEAAGYSLVDDDEDDMHTT